MQNNHSLEEIWNQETWIEQARSIINGLDQFSLDSKIILLLRHSQRYEPEFIDENQNMELTPQGRKIAKYFGKKLPKTRKVRLFHSPVNRCKETAEQIHNGFEENRGKSIFEGECKFVWGIGMKTRFFISELQKHGYFKVFYRWIAGFYNLDDMPSIIPYCQRGADFIWNQAKKEPKNGIDIYISHDWHIHSFRFGWFGLPPDDKWIGYLGGFAFTFEEDRIHLLDYGQHKSTDIPHWWNI
ncbi:MAG: histidine phosphatase family protein [Promethearchaeota archaeon]|jgi:hypothetical protein